MDGESLGHCFELLLAGGALDVWATPILMKKNRPAYMLSVLGDADSEAQAQCRELLFRHTSTFGLREQRIARRKLARKSVTVQTRFGPIRVKVGTWNGAVMQTQPEYEDCRAAAETHGVPLKEIRRDAIDAYWNR
jgi:hypothetical protein